MRKVVYLIILISVIGFTSSQLYGEGTELKPGKVSVTWTPYTVKVCPPGIFEGEACKYPNPLDVIQKLISLIMTIAPPILVILLILGGLIYLLTPVDIKKIALGHKYIQYAVYGYILLLLITLIFSLISAILGGPTNP